LGDYGTIARIVDWDQLDNGLLGITVSGLQRFDLFETETRSDGLVVGHVMEYPAPEPTRMREQWLPLLDVLRGIESHPHVERMQLNVDYNDAWQVVYTLIQLLPLEEALKYELLGIEDIDGLMGELDTLLNQISGED
jgi:Lon protease-like protein